MSRQPGRRRSRTFYAGSWITLRIACGSCGARLGDFCKATSGSRFGDHTWIAGPIEQYRHLSEDGFALVDAPLKATMSCEQCPNAPQVRFDHMHTLLERVVTPGLHKTWRITDAELAAAIGNPGLFSSWLRGQASMIR